MRYNATATVSFTVGIKQSACINYLSERWLDPTGCCDIVESDIIDDGVVDVLAAMGVDLDKQGSFIAKVNVLAQVDEAPEYEIKRIDERVFSMALQGYPYP